MSIWRGVLAAILVVQGAHAAAPAWKKLAQEGVAAYESSDRAGALTRFAAAVADPGFATASSAERHAVLLMAGNAAKELQRWDDCLRFSRAAAALPERTTLDLYGALLASHELKNARVQVEVLTEFARFAPAEFRKLDEVIVLQAFRDSRALFPGDPVRLQLLEAAFDAGYRTNNGEVSGWVWIDLARLLLQRGDAKKAERVIREIDNPADLVDVRADKRFAGLVSAHPELFDVVAAARQWVARMETLTSKKPRSLEAVHELARALSAAGRTGDALKVVDLALARPPKAFDDLDDQLPWLRDERSRLFWRLGRWPEAIAELERGAALPEYGTANTSQTINLAQHYCDVGQPAQALKTLARTGPASPYGKMEMEMARVRAADALGDAATVAASLGYLRDHEPDGPTLLRETLVTLGLFDDAAKVLIAELDDPVSRTDALHDLQEFDDGPEPPAPAKWKVNRPKLLAREDVKAAIARYGRIDRYPLPLR